jgi:ribosomal protein L16, bacterial/organelle
MILQKPRKTKFKKQQRRSFRTAQKSNFHKGFIGVVALDNFWFSYSQMEACRKTILRYSKRTGKIYSNILPDKPISKKTEGARMGTGKGSVAYWVMPIRKGRVLFELKNIPDEIAKKALTQVGFKLPVKTILYEKNWSNFK